MTHFSDLHLFVLEKGEFTCTDLDSLLGDYVDGELPSTLCARLDQHVAECQACQELKDGYLLTVQLAGELRAKPVPTAVHNRLRDALNEKLGLTLPQYQDPADSSH